MVLLFCVNDEIIRSWTKNLIKVTHSNDTGLDMKCSLTTCTAQIHKMMLAICYINRVLRITFTALTSVCDMRISYQCSQPEMSVNNPRYINFVLVVSGLYKFVSGNFTT